jgi:polyhydroxyalkanoate synthesis repressor PhaR
MADQMDAAAAPAPGHAAPKTPPVVVKKYANRRLYNTESSSYVTLEDLAAMVRQGRDFVVYDAKSGDDITRGVLTQIIVEEEAKGSHLLPESFLRQLIGLYGGDMGAIVPRYLEHTMAAFARQQESVRQAMGSFGPFGEAAKQNMALMERAFALFNPFAPRPTSGAGSELEQLRAENAALRAELERAKGAGR